MATRQLCWTAATHTTSSCLILPLLTRLFTRGLIEPGGETFVRLTPRAASCHNKYFPDGALQQEVSAWTEGSSPAAFGADAGRLRVKTGYHRVSISSMVSPYYPQ